MRCLIEKILYGLTGCLSNLFNYSVYTNNVDQKLRPPCFLVELINSDTKNYLGLRHDCINAFDIIHFSNDKKEILYAVGEKLTVGMEWITLSDKSKLHGTNMHYEIIDGVLHFFVNYNLGVNLILPDENEKMKDLEYGGVNLDSNS